MADIATLTLSPALDVSTSVDVVTPRRKLRCDAPRFDPGGGGINVARVAVRLGAGATAVAPLGGNSGALISEFLAAERVNVERIDLDATTRENFSVASRSTGEQFRFVLPPLALSAPAAQRCRDALLAAGAHARCVVVSGSIDIANPQDFFTSIVDLLDPTPVIIDTSGRALGAALHSGAAMVKPSARELSEVVGRPLVTERDILDAARETLSVSQVSALLTSIGAGGAFFLQRDRTPVRFRAPTVRVRSTIGAGDSLVAGVAVGLARGLGHIDACRLGLAAGTAAVLTDGTELCDPDVVDELLPLVAIDR